MNLTIPSITRSFICLFHSMGLTMSEQHKVSLSTRRAEDHSLNSGDRDLDIWSYKHLNWNQLYYKLGNIVFLTYIRIWWDFTRFGKIWWDLSRSVGLLRSVKFYWDLSGNVSIWIKISNMLPVRLPLHVSWSDADLDNSFLWLLPLRSWRLNLLFGFWYKIEN